MTDEQFRIFIVVWLTTLSVGQIPLLFLANNLRNWLGHNSDHIDRIYGHLRRIHLIIKDFK